MKKIALLLSFFISLSLSADKLVFNLSNYYIDVPQASYKFGDMFVETDLRLEKSAYSPAATKGEASIKITFDTPKQHIILNEVLGYANIDKTRVISFSDDIGNFIFIEVKNNHLYIDSESFAISEYQPIKFVFRRGRFEIIKFGEKIYMKSYRNFNGIKKIEQIFHRADANNFDKLHDFYLIEVLEDNKTN